MNLMLSILEILNPNNKEIILNNEKINNKGVNAKINKNFEDICKCN